MKITLPLIILGIAQFIFGLALILIMSFSNSSFGVIAWISSVSLAAFGFIEIIIAAIGKYL